MTLQDIIHYIEVGAGKRFIKFVLPVLAVLVLGLLYDFRAWTNFSAPEAMDQAQLARNIAHGKGYTTLYVRPLSVYLLEQKNQAKTGASPSDTTPSDPVKIKTTGHPDLANPPVYPLVLAGLMKILPFNFAVNLKSAFWANNGVFWRYQPDFVIGVFNEVLFFVAVIATYFIARKLFDEKIAQLAALLTLGCALLWHFSASGLSTMLLLLIFLGLVWCLIKIEENAREGEPDTVRIMCWSIAVGLLAGMGMLTRYSFGWVIIPVAGFLVLFSGPKKFLNLLVTFIVFAVVIGPWLGWITSLCGTPFGTAGYAIFAGTAISPESQLEHSLHPEFIGALSPGLYWHKFLVNFHPIIDSGLANLGGNWVGILFFAGLLLGFNRLAVRRLRYFLLMCLATFIVVQALGRTSLSETSEINSENMLVFVVPLVIIYGTAFFFILMDQMKLPARELRYVVIGIFVVLCCLPLFFSMWFKSAPVIYPPYYPPDIEKVGGWMKPDEMIMSDVPWAVAWYGQRQSILLTVDAQDQFFAVNDYVKPVSGLYLTMQTMDGKLVSDCFRRGKDSWGSFVLGVLTQNKIPTNFPLHHSPVGSAGIMSGIFLTDADRWKLSDNTPQ
jgi:hypothetical protein